MCGNPDRLPFEDESFNNTTAFFAFSKIKNSHIRHEALKETARILKKNGKLYIWDINIKMFQIALKKRLRVLLPENKYVSYNITRFSFPGGFDMNTFLPAVERYFSIQEAQNCDGYFYLKAVKKDDI